MAPPFSSSRQAIAFSALILLVIVGPLLVARTGWLRREQVYPAIPLNYGTFPYVHQKIFQDRGPVDMAFVGSSGIWSGIDTPMVQKALSARLGRPAEVFTLGWPWPGYDAVYVVAKDLVERRAVNTLVVYDEPRATDTTHLRASCWFRVGENSDVFTGLPWRQRVALYGSAILGLPRQLLSAVRPNLVEDPATARPNLWMYEYLAPNPPLRLGNLSVHRTFPFKAEYSFWQPPGEPTAAGAILSESTRPLFDFAGANPAPYQRVLFGKLVELARRHRVKLVVLHIPDFSERTTKAIPMRQDWPEKTGPVVRFAGVRPTEFFRDLSPSDLDRLYYEVGHLNESGQQYLTRMVLPSLMELHELPPPQ